MSKDDKKIKKIVDYDSSDILVEGDLPSILRERAEYARLEALNKAYKDGKSEELLQLIKLTRSDGATYTEAPGRTWGVTTAQKQGGRKLNEDKLLENLAKIAKLPAPLIAKLLEASKEDTPAGKPYVVVTPPKEKA